MTCKTTLVVLPGDGIGPEVTAAALAVLEAVAPSADLSFQVAVHPIGGVALRQGLPPLPEATRDAAVSATAVLLGAVGDPAFDQETSDRRPERGLLALRAALGVYANLRPVVVDEALLDHSALRPERVRGTDVLIVRELLGGLYFGEPRWWHGDDAVDTMRYSRSEVVRVAHYAFRAARGRRRHVLSVDKANVLATSQLWREVVSHVAQEYPDVVLEHGLVDSVAMRLITAPSEIDVLLTENLFGDILSDEAAVLPGSLGLLPSASLGDGPGLFEPVHGSAPALAGRDRANPIGAIRSVALLLRHAFDRPQAADQVEGAVTRVLADGIRTPDLGGMAGTRAVTAAIVARLTGVADQHR